MELKKFKELVDSLQEAKDSVVFNKKISGVKVEVIKSGNKFKAVIDGDVLDTYKSQKEAESMAKQFVAQYKG
jgi:hypothetical protein